MGPGNENITGQNNLKVMKSLQGFHQGLCNDIFWLAAWGMLVG